jgi:preprotein translocase subunit SecG
MTTFLYVLHFLVCFVLIVVVLLQRGKGSDMGAALGGGGSNTVFGARGAGNFLSKATTASAIIFMGTSLSLAYFTTENADVRLFAPDEIVEETIVPETEAGDVAPSGALEEVDPAAANTLQEIPVPDAGGEEAP